MQKADGDDLSRWEGKVFRFMVDPVFGRRGWCLEGPLVSAMQTMEWASRLIKRPNAVIGTRLTVQDGKLVELKP